MVLNHGRRCCVCNWLLILESTDDLLFSFSIHYSKFKIFSKGRGGLLVVGKILSVRKNVFYLHQKESEAVVDTM